MPVCGALNGPLNGGCRLTSQRCPGRSCLRRLAFCPSPTLHSEGSCHRLRCGTSPAAPFQLPVPFGYRGGYAIMSSFLFRPDDPVWCRVAASPGRSCPRGCSLLFLLRLPCMFESGGAGPRHLDVAFQGAVSLPLCSVPEAPARCFGPALSQMVQSERWLALLSGSSCYVAAWSELPVAGTLLDLSYSGQADRVSTALSSPARHGGPHCCTTPYACCPHPSAPAHLAPVRGCHLSPPG